MIRLIAAGTLLAAALASQSAFAQGSDQRAYCLKSGSSQDCAYNSMAQCEAAKKANTDTCIQKSSPMSR